MRRRDFLKAAGAAALLGSAQRAFGAPPKSHIDNCILLSYDSLRQDHLGPYGFKDIPTPNFDKFAAGGVRFADAHGNCGWTLPQHMTMLTGLHPLTHNLIMLGDNKKTGEFLGGDKVLSRKLTPFAVRLRRQGVTTQAFNSRNGYVGARWGYPRGFDKYRTNFPYNAGTIAITKALCEWIGQNASKRFFIFSHNNDPHQPMGACEPFRNKHVKRRDKHHGLYLGEVDCCDHYFAQLIEALAGHKLLEKTLVIVTADHGYEFRDHGFIEKKINVYREIIRVPLILSCPGTLPAGKAVQGLCSSQDIAPTILELMGVEPTEELEGTSLVPQLKAPDTRTGQKEILTHTSHGFFHHWALTTDRYKLIRFEFIKAGKRWIRQIDRVARITGHGPKAKAGETYVELYDLLADPKETKLLTKQKPGVVEAMGKRLDALIARHREHREKLLAR